MTTRKIDEEELFDDFEKSAYEERDAVGTQTLANEAAQEEVIEKNQDPNELPLTLKKCIIDGESSVELFAHGEIWSFESKQRVDSSALLARVSAQELTMFPREVDPQRPSFFEPKYDELQTITIIAEKHSAWMLPETVREFDQMLSELPTGFSRHAIFGLGFKWEYRLIPEAILELDGVTELVLEPGDHASVELPIFRLGVKRFDKIRKAIDNIASRATSRSLKARRLVAYNETLHAALPNKFEQRYPEVKAGEIYELIQLRSREPNRSSKDGLAAAQLVQDDALNIVKEKPTKLLELKSVIEQVTLAELIGEFESMLKKNLIESKWQTFFKKNPFVLGLAFPYPVIVLQDQASVGGTTIRGNGESIVDFLMAQRFTGNLAIIEIKRPSASLVESKGYRGDLHAPHRELTASMAQVLDQRAQLLHHFAAKKSLDNALKEVHVSSVSCIVVVGTLPTEAAKIRSLDLFRHSSKDVSVITFDELLEKLKELYRLMSSSSPAPVQKEVVTVNAPIDMTDDIPF